jgi:hypothetical protein
VTLKNSLKKTGAHGYRNFMARCIFKKKNREDAFLKIADDIISTDFECSLESLSFSSKCEDVFLNRFTQSQVLEHLKKSGLLPALADLGFTAVVADIFKDDTGVHHLKITTGKKNKFGVLIDLRLSFKNVFNPDLPNPMKIDYRKLNFAVLEWISLENPLRKFTKDHPLLPGQVRPGLGLLRQTMNFLGSIGKSAGIDGIIIVPDHFHAAAMYSKYAFFVDPTRQGELSAVLKCPGENSIEELSWGFLTGTITDLKSGNETTYTPSPQVFPVSDTMKKIFHSKKYGRLTEKVRKTRSYSLDRQKMAAVKSRILRDKSISEL